MNRITVTASVALLVMWSCLMQPNRPPVTAPRTAVTVSASYGRTWDAVLAAFADRKIQVNTDRMSGTIASNAIGISVADSGGRDCGKSPEGKTLRPDAVRYRVTVKGDSTASTVLASALYGRIEVTAMQECGSLGTWEAAFEADVKKRAEQR